MSKMIPAAARPAHHHSLNPFVFVRGAAEFIDYVTYVFDATETTNVRTPDRDGSLIHAEVVIGDSTIMLADSKPGWPFTPGLFQVYVTDAASTLSRGQERGGSVVTPLSSFYGGYDLARLLDPWHNLWWLYGPATERPQTDERSSSTDWHDKKPSQIYTTLMDCMKNLSAPTSHQVDTN